MMKYLACVILVIGVRARPQGSTGTEVTTEQVYGGETTFGEESLHSNEIKSLNRAGVPEPSFNKFGPKVSRQLKIKMTIISYNLWVFKKIHHIPNYINFTGNSFKK